jgi:hypothetical protein
VNPRKSLTSIMRNVATLEIFSNLGDFEYVCRYYSMKALHSLKKSSLALTILCRMSVRFIHPSMYIFITTPFTQVLSWDSAVIIATGYGLDDRGVGFRVPVGSRIFSSPFRPERLWGPTNLLSNGYWRFFL